ncbi:hypothetical protein [uncultured Tateyamaria sp.]|uniref:hypothetical protein n=1 Tax=uncultured Tateyamaria sp. TaxID=455651 RepID=UPI0026350B67|nr:hypothetical protein [uncultured Tateyamaria sp.]
MGTTFARLFALILILAPTAVAAQETDVTGKVAVELNTVSDGEGTCTLTFMVTNGHPVDIDKLVYETVLFDAAGRVDRLTLFDFGALPVGRPRVRQFAVPELSCEGLGRVLFNGLHTCTAEGLAQGDCAKGLLPSSRVEIEVLG